ncbi:MAG: DUF3500 domain-containing protein [Microbacteriaceae bacterium]|nr:DUF3500 domain-containing protein [Microbacteriaceae bacterium]
MTMPGAYRQYLFPHDDPRLAGIRGADAYAYRELAKQDDFTGGLIRNWAPLYPSEFRGLTTDGSVVPGLFPVDGPVPAEEAAPTAAMVDAARAFLATLTEEQAAKARYAADAVEWQSWSNPEFMIHDTGLRLEFQPEAVRDAALELVRASLGEDGCRQVRTVMRINGFLGELNDLESVMNEFSYHFALYGEPSPTDGWGWQLFGHHLGMNCFVQGDRFNLTPTFMGAEPNGIDAGPHRGATAFTGRIRLARELVASLSDEERTAARTYDAMEAPEMAPGRVDPGDERHLGGAFQDNRVVPAEGVAVATLREESQDLLLALVAESLTHWPEGPAKARLRQVREHLDETWFGWIGGFGPDDPFYYRIQSPVAFFELDHHCGVFLSNRHPAVFHIHTVERTPNGNDYGRAWLRNAQHALAAPAASAAAPSK